MVAWKKIQAGTAALALLWLACGASDARKLAQAPAPGPSGSSAYVNELLRALVGNASESGPILYKTFEAAYFSLLAEDGGTPQLVNDSQLISIGNDSRALVAWSAGNSSLILAFATSASDNASMTQPVTNLSPISYLGDFFGGNAPGGNPAALQLFSAFLTNVTASNGAISSVIGSASNSSIRRVLCTGHAGGGSLAQLCGPWAQIAYPQAQVRVITFGAPRVADDKFNWALEQLVDLPYFWLTSSDNTTVGQTPQGPLLPSNITRVIPEANQTGQGQRGSIEFYSTLLNNTLKANNSAIPVTLQTNFSYGYLPSGRNTQFVASAAPQGGGFFASVSSAIGTAADTISAAGSAVSNIIGNIFGPDSPAPAPGPPDIALLSPGGSPGGSPQNTGGAVQSASVGNASGTVAVPILAKLQPAIRQACAAYGNGATLGPGSITVTADNTSTNVAVAWNQTTRVATFAWRGTQETEDWKQNLKLQFSDDTSSEYFSELYTGSRVYEGELNQFRAVTDQASGNNTSIRAQIDQLSGGATPSRVDCIGHSLGAGLATICGPWAAEEWPTADVRVVNFGSPKAGNMEFAESVFATVGRIYRVVHQRDAVPSLPPFSRYLHANQALWINGSAIILDDRPPMDIDDLTWDDHGCDDQYTPAIRAARNVTIPSWALALP